MNMLSSIGSTASTANEAWLRANVNLDAYYTFHAITEAIHNFDIGFGKNYFLYHDPTTNKWQVVPWDLDLTFYVDYEPGRRHRPARARRAGAAGVAAGVLQQGSRNP